MIIIELNSHIAEDWLLPTPEEQNNSLQRVGQIVTALEATAGFWLGPSGERAIYIDKSGKPLSNMEALTIFSQLIPMTSSEGAIAVPISAPHTIEEIVREKRIKLIRTKNDGRSLGVAATDREVHLAGDLYGRISYTVFQPHFDALFAIAKTLELLARSDETLANLRDQLPQRPYRQLQLPCSWEYKGGIMRLMNEATSELQTTFIDGVKVHFGEDWILVVPDPYQPLVHLISEAAKIERAEELIKEYRSKVEEWLLLLQNPA